MVELVRGKDKKRYPVLPRTPEEHMRLVALSHTLRCGRRLTYTLIQEALVAEFGVRRSRGAISKDLNRYTCPLCAPGGKRPTAEMWSPPAPGPPTAVPAVPAAPPTTSATPRRPRVRPEVYPWR